MFLVLVLFIFWTTISLFPCFGKYNVVKQILIFP